jgi:hypothetical protein
VVDEVGSDDPARAFEDLRAEVSVLRRAVEAIPQTLEAGRAPDYGADLAKLTKGLAAVASQVEVLGQHPALRMTPADHAKAIGQSGSDLVRGALQGLQQATLAAEGDRRELAAMVGAARTQEAQVKVVAIFAAIGLVVGLVLSPLFASALPFGLNGRVAALVMRDSRWNAGEALMAAESPQGWENLRAAAAIMKANQARFEACRDAVAKTGKSQVCSVFVGPDEMIGARN